MASANRFALLDDDEPKVAKVVAPPPAPVEVKKAPVAPNRGDGRGAPRGRGRGGNDRPYRARQDGETNPYKPEFDKHVSRTDYAGGRGRGRGGRGGPRKQGHGNYNTGPVDQTAGSPPAEGEEVAVDGEAVEAPAAADEEAVVAEPEPVEEEDKTLTLAQFLAAKEASKLVENLSIRQAGEESALGGEEDLPNAKALEETDLESLGVLGNIRYDAAGKEIRTGGGKKKNTLEGIDFFFAAPAPAPRPFSARENGEGFRGGRGRGGQRGGGQRGGSRGGFSPKSPVVNIDDARAFPSLGGK